MFVVPRKEDLSDTEDRGPVKCVQKLDTTLSHETVYTTRTVTIMYTTKINQVFHKR